MAVFGRQKEVCLFLLSKIIFILGKRACCVHGFSVGVMRLFVRPITAQQNVLLHRLSSIMKTDANSDIGGYLVRSLYFDSIYDDDYFDKINGLESRKKIRLRIYSPGQHNAKLELKQKQGAAQRKKSLIITRHLAEEMIMGNYSGLANLDSELAMKFYQLMETGIYRPKCIVEYHRIAFAENSNEIRITFDSEIGANYHFEDFFKRDLTLIPVWKEPILEVKYNGFLLENIKKMLDFADSSELAVSKYAMSRQLLEA